jgi:hypothetical protein
MNCSITITRRQHKPVMDPGSLVVVPVTSKVLYTGLAFIHAQGNGPEVFAGEQGIPSNSTVISIPMEWSQVRPDDMIAVLSCVEDTTMVGLDFRIASVGGAGIYSSTRQLACVVWADSQRWERPS